jgi:hypothetical protein
MTPCLLLVSELVLLEISFAGYGLTSAIASKSRSSSTDQRLTLRQLSLPRLGSDRARLV